MFDDNLDQYKTRGERLERARNKIIEKIKSEPDLRDCDLLVILDCDDTGEYRINNENILKSLEFLFSKKILQVFLQINWALITICGP